MASDRIRLQKCARAFANGFELNAVLFVIRERAKKPNVTYTCYLYTTCNSTEVKARKRKEESNNRM